MLTDLVRPGEKIEIQAVENAILGSSTTKKIYTSKIYDVIDDEQMEILMPMDGTKLILLPVDGEYQFCFYTQKGLYQCFIRIVDRYKSNNTYLLLCEVTSPLGKYQRREYYRYACTLPVKTRDLMDEEIKSIEEKKYHPMAGLPMKKGQIVDIGGGGIRFMTTIEYKKGMQIAVNFLLNLHGKETPYDLVGEVLSCKEHEIHKGEYEHRLKFTVITHGEREEIIRYIFEEERKSRSRM
jgi:c-di-GMP-binding flagellar brake protein YcgR